MLILSEDTQAEASNRAIHVNFLKMVDFVIIFVLISGLKYFF